MIAKVTLNAKGLNCPMPIIKAKIEMDKLNSGDVLEVLTTDPGSIADFRGWSKQIGHFLEKESQLNEADKTVYQFFIRHK